MKTIFFSIYLLIAATVSASINPIDLIIQADPTSHTLTLRTTTDVDLATTVKIVDADGLVLHTTKLDSGDYLNTRFKLSALPAGTYSVEVSDVQGKTVQPITVGATGITADPALAVRTFYPRIDLDKKLLTINYLNTGGERVEVRLADDNGNEIITDRLPAATTVQRAYSLENLPAGAYYVTVSSPSTQRHTTSLRLE
jgi:hypothetical protein